VIIFIALILIGLLFSATSKFFYILSRVDQNQVGVKFRSGKIYEIVGPGVYSDAGLYVELKRVSSQAVPFFVKDAEASAEQTRQEGEIRVAQSRIQEETRQQTILAQLQLEKLVAQKVVIEAEKANELLAAQQDLAINKAQAAAATGKVKVELAKEIALAELYSRYTDYMTLQIALANAAALKPTDKVIFTLEGMTPTLVLPGPGIVPTVETSPDEVVQP